MYYLFFADFFLNINKSKKSFCISGGNFDRYLFVDPQVPEFTIGMLIASAKAGRWLYD
ncbi:DUF1493 family protein [Salmonella enterica subsp. enterica serovar Bareilly]|nr:DUF1493 family protein [Salmonella enterica subsp. enterica serovar Bareilly]